MKTGLATSSVLGSRVRYQYHLPTRITTGVVVDAWAGRLAVRLDDGSMLVRMAKSFDLLDCDSKQ